MTHEDFMRLAIDVARQGRNRGEMPFGACIVKRGRVVTAVHNVARERTDITAHAEMHAIQEACRILDTLDLSGCAIYTSCEPCPMCFSACVWARLDRIVYGSRIEDAERSGIRQMPIASATMRELSRASIEVLGDVLRGDSVELFKDRTRAGRRRSCSQS
jgi:tRNA(Arg) A34 adenosine deaminase TadA